MSLKKTNIDLTVKKNAFWRIEPQWAEPPLEHFRTVIYVPYCPNCGTIGSGNFYEKEIFIPPRAEYRSISSSNAYKIVKCKKCNEKVKFYRVEATFSLDRSTFECKLMKLHEKLVE